MTDVPLCVRVRVRERVSGRVTDRVRVRRPDSSGNLLIWHKLHYARFVQYRKIDR